MRGSPLPRRVLHGPEQRARCARSRASSVRYSPISRSGFTPSWARRNIFITIFEPKMTDVFDCSTAGMCGGSRLARRGVPLSSSPELRGGAQPHLGRPTATRSVRRRRKASSVAWAKVGVDHGVVEQQSARRRPRGRARRRRRSGGRRAAASALRLGGHGQRHDVGVGLAVGVVDVDEAQEGVGASPLRRRSPARRLRPDDGHGVLDGDRADGALAAGVPAVARQEGRAAPVSRRPAAAAASAAPSSRPPTSMRGQLGRGRGWRSAASWRLGSSRNQ